MCTTIKEYKMSKKKEPIALQTFFATLLALTGSKLIFSYFDFDYELFISPFDLTSFLINISVFFTLFFIGVLIFNFFWNLIKK